MIASAASSIKASRTSTSRKPTSAISGRRSAATIGSSSALSTPITAAAANAPQRSFTAAPGITAVPTTSAIVESSHETSTCSTPMRGRVGLQTDVSPYTCAPAVISGQTLSRA